MKKIFIILLVAIVLISGCASIENEEQQPTAVEPEFSNEVSETSTTDIMQFIVTVPENTPENDIVNIVYHKPSSGKYPFSTLEVPMTKTGPYTYEIELTLEEAALDEEKGWGTDQFEYIYNRNGWGDITTEYLPLNTENREPGNEFEYRNAKHQVTFKEDTAQEDVVTRWRWFPEGAVDYTTDLEPSAEFQPRVNGIEFRSGQGIQDLYIPGFENFYDSTAEHMVDYEYQWAVLYPPWQWYEDNPPKVGNSLELGVREDPNYPDDEELRRHIRAFKKAGLKISMEAQICCTAIDTEGRSVEWWSTYADEVERFLIHHATLSEEEGVEVFMFDTFGLSREKTPNYNERMEEMLDAVKEVYSGEIMIPISPFLYQVEAAEQTIPTVEEVPWASKADLFLYNAEGELSPKENPTDAELATGAGRNLDLMKQFYDTYNKPVMVKIAPSSIKQSWRGPAFYAQGIIPGESGAENIWEFHEFSNEDQARVVNAYFTATAERPWIVGMVQFGYWHWDMPNLPDWSARGKPAEDVWRKWNAEIYN